MAERSTNPREFLTAQEQEAIEQAIGQVEQRTSAELKLLIVRHCWGDIRDKARQLFFKHGLDQTQRRNAVMILLVTTNRELLIYGDEEINEKLGEHFWQETCNLMIERFRTGRYGEGICEGIGRIAEPLVEHFPSEAHDPNELSNEIAFDQ